MISWIVGLFVAALVALALFTFAQSRRIEARYPPVGELVDVGPGVVHVVETAPTGPERGAVLLVHGASGNYADMHEALAPRLAGLGFRVFAVDRPGHGWSSRLGGPDASAPIIQAEWIRRALAIRGVDRAIVVVHSLAGVLGLAMALEAPRFTRGLVLLSPVSHPWPGGVLWYYNLAASKLWGPLFRGLVVLPVGLMTMAGGVRSVFEPSPTPADYIARTRLPLVLRPKQFRANAEDVFDIAAHAAVLSKRYGAIRAPTAIVTGGQDSVVYAHIHSTGSARDIPGATLRVLEGVGHSPHYSAPDVVIDAILEVDRRAAESEASPAPMGLAGSAG